MTLLGFTISFSWSTINFIPLSRDGQDPPSKKTVATSETERKQEIMADELSKLERAFSRQVLYVIGKEHIKIRAGTYLRRMGLLSAFLWIRDKTEMKIANLRAPTDRVVEVGFGKEF